MPDWVKSIDNIHNTRFTELVYYPTQIAMRKAVAFVHPFFERAKVVKKALDKYPAAMREHLTSYIETMSAEEVKTQFLARPLGLNEIDTGKWLADNEIDLDKVMLFRKAWRDKRNELKREAATSADASIDYDIALSEVRLEHNLDDLHYEAYQKIEGIREFPIDKYSILGTTAYARALINKTMTRAEYAKHHNLPKEFVTLAEEIEQIWGHAAEALEIDNARRISRYMPHYKKMHYEFSDIADVTSDVLPEDFISEMIRVGEIPLSQLERDPITLMIRYFTSAARTKMLNPAIMDAKKAWMEQLKTIPSEVARGKITERVESYLHGISGKRDITRKFWAEGVSYAMAAWGKNVSPEDVMLGFDNMLRHFAASVEVNAQGFRPSQGMRDYIGSLRNYYVRFGAARAQRLAKISAGYIPDGDKWKFVGREAIDAFIKSGKSPSLSAFDLVTGGTDGSPLKARLGRGVDTYVEAAFSGSLQKPAYDRLHAATAIETISQTFRSLRKLSADYGWNEFAKDMQFDSYDPSVVAEFKTLFDTGKYEELANRVGHHTGTESIFLYGASNHPMNWQRYAGKLLGQFGTWSVYQTRYLARLAARGSLKNRVARLRRYAAAEMAFIAADAYTGLNMTGWMSMAAPANLLFAGGPVMQAALNTLGATNTNEYVAARHRNDFERNLTLFAPYLPLGAARGWNRAFDLWERDFNPMYSGASVLGMSVDEMKGNWWDSIATDGQDKIDLPFMDPVEYTLPSVGYNRGVASPLQQDIGESPQPRER
jgi:hypothetical protein